MQTIDRAFLCQVLALVAEPDLGFIELGDLTCTYYYAAGSVLLHGLEAGDVVDELTSRQLNSLPCSTDVLPY